MGYFGLDHWMESDSAADLFVDVNDSIVNTLTKGLKSKDNDYNTSGAVNVGLIIQTLPNSFFVHDNMIKLVQKTIDQLEVEIEEIKSANEESNDKNAKWHISSYRKIINKLKKKIK